MTSRTHRIVTVGIAAMGGLAVWVVANEVFPYHSLNHDEAVYLQQAAMLLDGRLVLRPPVADVFRPWFFVDAGDRLYPKYAPVPAAMFALGRLLGGYRLALAGIAAANLALVAAVVREVFDRRTGLLAAGFVLASPLFLIDSAVFLPYAPTTMLNLTFGYAYLRADRTDDRRWSAVAGGSIGLAFFARPYTAVLFAAPFVVHALWTVRTYRWEPLPRLATTGALGLAGVVVTLAYNAAMTGSPLVFPYGAFAPLDGLGFGRRELGPYGVRYTPMLAVRANSQLAVLFFTEWFAGGILGTALVAAGLLLGAHRGATARTAMLAGLFVSILAGNGYFWGTLNVLGDIQRAGDGLVAVLGPYYHFDLLLPTGAFAARGTLGLLDRLRDTARGTLDADGARVAVAAVLVVAAVPVGAVTADDVDQRLRRNLEVTDTYERAYQPFDRGLPGRSVVLVPTPYGDWLTHPFQTLRNDPGFDGRVVYAIDDRPFAVADAFPDRTLYRYGYRGAWAPAAGSPAAARLQRVRAANGSSVSLDATVGVPRGAVGVTARIATDHGSGYYVARNASEELDLRLVVADERVRLAGDVRPVSDEPVAVTGRDTVRLSLFVDYGPAGGITYRFDLPVAVSPTRVRALSPRIEWCRDVRLCGGAATLLPARTPDGVFVRTELTATEHNP